MNKCKHCGEETGNAVFCSMACYGKWQKGKSFSEQRKKERPEKHCSIDGCQNPHSAKGYCRKHYIKLIIGDKRYTPKKTFVCKNCGVSFNANIRSYGRTPMFCSMKCNGENKRKPFIIKRGYKKILIPDHDRSDKKGYVFEHIVVAEKKLGRKLFKGEECHHKDRNRQNNDPSNIIVCHNHYEHMQYHATPECVIE